LFKILPAKSIQSKNSKYWIRHLDHYQKLWRICQTNSIRLAPTKSSH